MNKKKIIFKFFKIIIPIFLLYYIYTIIEIDKIIYILKNSDITLILVALLSVPIQYILFSIRWKSLLYNIEKVKISFLRLHGILYQALFIGFFVPSGVGIDIFRAIKIFNQTKTYKSNVSSILLEKSAGTIASVLMIIISFPFIDIVKTELVDEIGKYSVLFFIISFFIIVLISFKNTLIKGKVLSLLKPILSFINDKIVNILKKTFLKNKSISIDDNIVKEIFEPLLSIKNISVVIFFSILIIIVKAFFMNLIFFACGYDLPIFANIFVVPLVNLISLMPISFGGVGVREASVVILYGLFGVPAEASLFVSLISFFYVLVNISLGGVFMLYENSKLKENK
jgi:glycosyltransferase 2 family protein